MRRMAIVGVMALLIDARTQALPSPLRQAPAASPTSPQFEVASIKPNRSGTRQVNLDLQPGGRFTATNVTLQVLIGVAYGDERPLMPNRMSINQAWIGGGNYLLSDHFDVVAKAEGEISRALLPVMLRALLADRFKLVVHHDVRELPIYALSMARKDGRLGPRLRRSSVDCPTVQDGKSAQPAAPPPVTGEFVARPCSLRSVPGRASGRAVTMATAASLMSGWIDDHRPVEDRTGLEGAFDLDLDWTPTAALPADAPPLPPIDPNGPSLFTALREQLGLKVEPAKNRIDILVVDRADRPSPD